jgi:hypothetical protein
MKLTKLEMAKKTATSRSQLECAPFVTELDLGTQIVSGSG